LFAAKNTPIRASEPNSTTVSPFNPATFVGPRSHACRALAAILWLQDLKNRKEAVYYRGNHIINPSTSRIQTGHKCQELVDFIFDFLEWIQKGIG
jgi:hypothetical protein